MPVRHSCNHPPAAQDTAERYSDAHVTEAPLAARHRNAEPLTFRVIGACYIISLYMLCDKSCDCNYANSMLRIDAMGSMSSVHQSAAGERLMARRG